MACMPLPQAIGMVIVAVIYSAVVTIKGGETSPFIEAVSYKQIFSGFFFAFAALTYLISAQPDMNGLATGFILSQTSVVLATLTGIWFLGQKKTAKEMTVTIIGLVLILAAATITVMMKSIQRPIIQGVEYFLFVLKIMQQLWKELYFAPN